MDFTELGQTLAQLRKSQQLSQQTMATDLHISRATISNFENGTSSDIGLKKVMQMLDYMGYTLSIKEESPFPTFEEIVNG